MKLILLSGPIAVGKSYATASLINHHRFQRISSSSYLREQLLAVGLDADRRSLQNLGDKLDQATDFRWLVDEVALPMFAQSTELDARWLLDAVRKRRQVEHFKDAVPAALHFHLTASEQTLRKRYEERQAQTGSQLSYNEAISHPNEDAARGLESIADFVISAEEISPEEVAQIILDKD